MYQIMVPCGAHVALFPGLMYVLTLVLQTCSFRQIFWVFLSVCVSISICSFCGPPASTNIVGLNGGGWGMKSTMIKCALNVWIFRSALFYRWFPGGTSWNFIPNFIIFSSLFISCQNDSKMLLQGWNFYIPLSRWIFFMFLDLYNILNQPVRSV